MGFRNGTKPGAANRKGIDGLITLTMHIKSVRNAAAWLT